MMKAGFFGSVALFGLIGFFGAACGGNTLQTGGDDAAAGPRADGAGGAAADVARTPATPDSGPAPDAVPTPDRGRDEAAGPVDSRNGMDLAGEQGGESGLQVDAGPDKELAFPAQDLSLFGHAAHPQDLPFTIAWTLVDGPAAVNFSAPGTLATTVTFSVAGTYVFQLEATDGTLRGSDRATVTVKPAATQTAFYVDPSYSGSTPSGGASAPWKSLFDGDDNQSAKWATINEALATSDVIVYFSARSAATDVSEESLAALRVMRTDISTHRLTLDGMSKYATNDAAPNWVDYTGSHKFRLRMPSGYGDIALGESDHSKFNYTTIRGFEVTGSGARTVLGGSYVTLEYIWIHDITTVGATLQYDSAVTPFPECKDIGRNRDITLRNITIERGIGEGMYIAGTYLNSSEGGCPSYGNTHSDILIEGNAIRDAGFNDLVDDQGDAIDLKAGLQNVTIRNNVIDTTHANPADDGGAGIVVLGTFNSAPTNYLIEGNRLYRTWGSGMMLGNLHGAIIRNNVVALAGRGPLAQIGIDFSGDRAQMFINDNVQIYNNTVYGSAGYGVVVGVVGGPITIRNNLVVANSSSGDTWDVTGTISSDYNLWAPAAPDNIGEGTHSKVLPEASGIVTDPTNDNYRLGPASPAKGQGIDLSVLVNLASGSTSFNWTADGLIRPHGTAWDVGAY